MSGSGSIVRVVREESGSRSCFSAAQIRSSGSSSSFFAELAATSRSPSS